MPSKGSTCAQRPHAEAACPTCQSVFFVPFHQAKSDRTRYCSKPCADIGRSIPLADRYWQYVNKTETCWLWTGRDATKTGYARTRRGGGKGGRILVHRAAWWFASGTEPSDDMHVGHVCDVTNCVRNNDEGVYIVDGIEYRRFGHLFLCPQIVNEADKVQKGRQARGNANGRVLHPDSYPTGAEWPMAKVTDDDVRSIRSLYGARQATQVELANRYGMRQSSISAIILRKTWKHLP